MSTERPTNKPVDHVDIENGTVAATNKEQRRAQRRRTLKSGLIAYNNRFNTLSCVVRDVSPTGAKLKVESSVSAPDMFDLIIELDGLEASCQVVWREDNEIGVRFLAPPRTGAPKRAQVITPMPSPQKPSLRRKPKTDGLA